MRKRKVIVILFLIVSFLMFSSSIQALDVDTKYNNYQPNLSSCGEGLITNIPDTVPKVISIFYIILQIAVPVLVIIFGTLDLMKSVAGQKEEEIKKGQQLLIKRIIVAIIVFFVFVIVKVLVSAVADSNGNKIIKCAECFINNDCDKVI